MGRISVTGSNYDTVAAILTIINQLVNKDTIAKSITSIIRDG